MKKLFFLLFAFTSLFSQSLHEHPEWKTLLHFKNSQSEIDDRKFFLAPNGKIDLKAELEATITKMQKDESDDDNSTICRYPARHQFLKEHLPKIANTFPPKKCERLNKFLEATNPQKVSISFPTAHINSPASMFGHTLLKVDSEIDSSLVSNAINYAAITNETNGFLFAYNGLFGGYEGRYSILPYYKKIEEYNGVENRDIWEYELNLTPEEAKRVVLYTYELEPTYSDYFFLSENCSYNLLWVLQYAKRSKINLTENFSLSATPIDTIREVEKNGLIKKANYRHSKVKLIKTIFQKVEDKDLVVEFIENGYDFTLLTSLNKEQKIYTLDIAINSLQADFIAGKLERTKYLKSFLKLLKKRSKLGKIEEYKIETPTNPLKGDFGNKLTLSVFNDGSKELNFHPAYHDIYDLEKGYISGAYITFLDTTIKQKNSKTTLEKLSILDIRSYAIQDFFFKPTSWEVRLLLKRYYQNKNYLILKSGAGITLGEENFFTYLMATPFIATRDSHTILGASGKIGVIKNVDIFKIGGFLEKTIYKDLSSNLSGEAYITKFIDKNFNIALKYKNKEFQKEQLAISLDYKF